MVRPIPQRELRRREEMPSAAVVGSMSIHALAVVFMIWGASRMQLPDPPVVYQVELVAPPRPEQPVREVPVSQSQERPAIREEIRSVDVRPADLEAEPRREMPPPEPEPEPEPVEEVEEEPAPEEMPPVEEEPAAPEETEEGSEDLPVRLEGAPFPYPDYLENIIRQIRRHWRPPAAGRNQQAELAFTILRDGSVVDVRWIRRSGDPAFDLEARGAIETAGRRGAFGPLPEGYPSDQLRVSFFFDPSRF